MSDDKTRKAEIERGAVALSTEAKRQVARQVFDPFVAAWKEKPLADLLEASQSVAMDAMTLALAGFIHAMSAGWEVTATAVIVKSAMADQDARIATAATPKDVETAVELRSIVEESCRLALARAFAQVDTVRSMHAQFAEAMEKITAAEPHDTEAK